MLMRILNIELNYLSNSNIYINIFLQKYLTVFLNGIKGHSGKVLVFGIILWSLLSL
jgi:hypothetical protein